MPTPSITKHFLAFFAAGLAVNCVSYLLIAEHFRRGSDFAFAATLIYAIYPVVVCIIMIRTCSTEQPMFLIQKLIPSIIYVTLTILSTIAINLINPYDRVIDQTNIQNGIENNFALGSVQIILLIPILYFVKPKIIQRSAL